MKVYSSISYQMTDTGMEQTACTTKEIDCSDVTMCGGGGKGVSTPAVEPVPPAVQKATTKNVTESATASREAQANKAKTSKGIKSTLLSSQEETATSNSNTLLG